MWFWIIVIAVIVGAIWGWLSSDGKSDGAVNGGCMGGMAAMGCLFRLAMAAIGIIIILWLFEAIFG